jgi:hypothetical protein
MRTLLLAGAAVLALTTSATAWATDPTTGTINNGGVGGTGGVGGAGGNGGNGGVGGAGGNSAASANARSASRSTSSANAGVTIGSGAGSGSVAVNASPGFALPSFGGGQCGIVGFGVAISPSGGGAFGPAWESTNCRNYYIALALLAAGRTNEGWALMAKITPEAAAVMASAPAQPGGPQASEPAPAPAPVKRPAWCARAKPSTDASRDYVARECG